MIAPLACILCMVDPQTTSMLVPLAQATVIAVPVLFRKDIARGVQRLRDARRADPARGTDVLSEPEGQAADGVDPPGGVHP